MRGRRLLPAILLLAVLLRLGVACWRGPQWLSTDERHWDRAARAFVQEGLLAERAGTYRPPLYALLVAGTYAVTGAYPVAVKVWQAGLGAATCLLLYALGRRLSGPRAGLLAAGAGAVYPLLVLLAGMLMAETLLVFLVAASLYAFTGVVAAPGWQRAAGAGVLLGLAVLCKPVVLAWLPFLVAILWWHLPACRRRRAVLALTLVGAVLMTVMPWTVRNLAMTGHLALVSTNLGVNLLVGHEPGAVGVYRHGLDYLKAYEELVQAEPNPVLADRRATRTVVGWMVAQPVRTLVLAGRKLVALWNPWATGARGWQGVLSLVSTTPVLALGLWGTWQHRRSVTGLAIAGLAVALTLVHALVFAHTRFRLPLDVVLLAPAAACVAGWRRPRSRERRP